MKWSVVEVVAVVVGGGRGGGRSGGRIRGRGSWGSRSKGSGSSSRAKQTSPGYVNPKSMGVSP